MKMDEGYHEAVQSGQIPLRQRRSRETICDLVKQDNMPEPHSDRNLKI